MYNILRFSRNRSTTVEQTNKHNLKSTCHLNDTLMDATVEITVSLPDLEISSVKGEMLRPGGESFEKSIESIKKVTGVRIGPGMLKIIKGLIGKDIEHKQLAFMVEECCHSIILSFTKEELLRSPRPDDEIESIKYHRQMALNNIRLYNRCAAFAPGSRIVNGIKPVGG